MYKNFYRGNHETDDMNKIYGFQGEVKAKYGEVMYEVFREVFSSMPIACCIDSKVLVSFIFILYYFILFYFILFYFILFYFILFYFILFYFILFYFILFYFIDLQFFN